MTTFKIGDRVRYAGKSIHPSCQREGDLGTVMWAGGYEHQPNETLPDWVRVKWDNPVLSFEPHMRANMVRLSR